MLWLTQRCQLLIVWLMIATQLAVFLGFSSASDGSLESRVIIANTVDGSFLGLDVSSGKELWKISGPPLVSQSLSDLRLVTEDSDYTIVPSLDGQLYLLEKRLDDGSGETSLKALPLTVDSLFSSNFMLTENSILTGGKDNSLFAFNPMSGEVS
ncbi:Eukaryotic translation initiation factor 2-alpha kinase [Fasciola gigantica]|uniref:Eukaryotic translation initiation factor 2-alpha kinase n=1 Tax=Fasciola gigantica TaxID=46835 RepID=A0A504Z858_FASGI|nr:Eukaryotic translation initiation factor 2-alpha kinase [Fasciola gigantica]